MLSQCIAEENADFVCLSIAPGKVDTPMQNDIRFADESEFPRLKEFQDYYKNGELIDSKEVAKKYKIALFDPIKYVNVSRISEI